MRRWAGCGTGGRSAGVVGGASLGAATLVAGCLPAPATTEAQATADLYAGFLAIAIAVGATVFGLATFAIVRYRVQGGVADRRLPEQTRGSLRLEALWTGIPIIIVTGLFAATLVVLGRVEARSPQPGVELRVEAFRWGWSFSYPAAGVTVSGVDVAGPEAVVPVGEPIRVTLAAHDVVHAFYVPVFLFKRDAIPGRESVFEFTVDEAGTFRGQCAEFCGVYHSRMPFSIRAVPRAEFEAWLAAQPRSAGTGPASSSAASP